MRNGEKQQRQISRGNQNTFGIYGSDEVVHIYIYQTCDELFV